MLQPVTKAQIEQFYKDVKALGLKFPVAVISDKTGEAKGNVSRYLSGKLEPGESFLRKFYKSFKIIPQETKAEEPETYLQARRNLKIRSNPSIPFTRQPPQRWEIRFPIGMRG